MNKIILEVKSFPKIFDSIGIGMVNQSYPIKKYFGDPIGGVKGVGGTVFALCHRLISQQDETTTSSQKGA